MGRSVRNRASLSSINLCQLPTLHSPPARSAIMSSSDYGARSLAVVHKLIELRKPRRVRRQHPQGRPRGRPSCVHSSSSTLLIRSQRAVTTARSRATPRPRAMPTRRCRRASRAERRRLRPRRSLIRQTSTSRTSSRAPAPPAETLRPPTAPSTRLSTRPRPTTPVRTERCTSS